MKVTREKTENHQAYLTIEMEPAELEEEMKASYRRLAGRANVPGFRKGKAPQAVLERYLGKETILDDALHHLVPAAYEDAIKEQGIKPAAQPDIEVTQTEPVVFKATVPLAPSTELGDIAGIKMAPEPVQVTGEQINETLETIRRQYATWEPVERPVQAGDLVVVDIESTVDGQPFISRKGAQYQVVSGSAVPVSGFAEQVTGTGRGEEKEFKLTFPADAREELAGKEASFKVKVNEIKEEKLPELDDNLALQVSPELKTLAELKERVTVRLTEAAREKARAEFEEKLIDEVVSRSKVEYPPVLVEAELDDLLTEQTRRLQMAGVDIEQYLKNLKKEPEEIRDDLRPAAVKRLVRALVLGQVAGDKKLEVSEAEIDEEVSRLVAGASKQDEMARLLGEARARASVRRYLLTQKTIKHLVESATAGEAKPEENQTGGEAK
ncbi:MAG: trigger factor [Chloroflexi bacterium]|nr:trigger factor [Chloroflexota bacterium]